MPNKTDKITTAASIVKELNTPKEIAGIAEKLRDGKAYVYTSKRKLVPLAKAKGTDIGSKAIKEDQQYWKEHGLITPPYNPESFIMYYESNGYFKKAVDQVAQDVSGQGWELEAVEGIDLEKDTKAKEFKERCQYFLNHPGGDKTIKEIIKALMIDYGAVGYSALEVARNNAGEVAAIYQIPSYTIKVHESDKKYCQTRYVRGKKKRVWFKKFGETVSVNSKTGDEYKRPQSGSMLANELIFKKDHFIRSDYYGVPKILGSIGAVVSLIGIRDFNLAFFENFGVPAALVILSGNWETGTDEAIMEFIDTEIRGSDNAHKTLALQLPESTYLSGGEKAGGGDITWVPLASEKTKEGSFSTYYEEMWKEVLMCYSMPPYRIGITIEGALGGNVESGTTRNYIDSMIDPLDEEVETVMNTMILPTFWEQTKVIDGEKQKTPIPVVFKIKSPDTRNIDADVERVEKLFDRGAARKNELRAAAQLSPLDEKEGGNDFYLKQGYTRLGEEEDNDLDDEETKLRMKIEAAVENEIERRAKEKTDG